MKNPSIITAAIAALLASGVAIAEPKPFTDVDTNSDGMVNAAEFANSGVQKSMKSLDTDKNGSLSKEEYSVVLEEECD